MKNNNSIWLKKRMKSGLSVSEMANGLGISYKKYKSIEKGRVKMPTKLIDKFNNLVGNKENKITVLSEREKANVWWDKMCVRNKNGEYALKKEMDKFNIYSYNQLADLVGGWNPTTLSRCLAGSVKTTANFKNAYYSFFQDELNIQDPSNYKGLRHSTKVGGISLRRNELTDFLSHYDICNLCRLANSEGYTLSFGLGIHYTMVSKLKSKDYLDKHCLRDETIKALKTSFEKNKSVFGKFYYEDDVVNSLHGLYKKTKTVKPEDYPINVFDSKEEVEDTSIDTETTETKQINTTSIDSIEQTHVSQHADIHDKYQGLYSDCFKKLMTTQEELNKLTTKRDMLKRELELYADIINDLEG